jgi:hypothetical protein
LQIESAHFERLAALRADVALFELWQRRAGSDPTATAAVRAAGYFDLGAAPGGRRSGGAAPEPARSNAGEVERTAFRAAIESLRERIAAAYGLDFLARRQSEVQGELAALTLRAVRQPDAVALDAYPLFTPVAAARLSELLEGLSALDVLAGAPPLREGTYRVAVAEPLSPAERSSLRHFADQLATDLVALPVSQRPDWGYPLLLGMARLAAIEASAALGQWVVLDVFPVGGDAAVVPGDAQREPYFAALSAQARAATARQRGEFLAQLLFRESDYTALEGALNRELEVEAGRNGAPMRLESEGLLPERPALRGDLVTPTGAAGDVAAELSAARAVESAYTARLGALYGYDLIRRNCVSEIFAIIDETFGGPSAAAQHLGGEVRTRGSLNFIPFVSAAAVDDGYATVAAETTPSYRQLRLAALRSAERSWWVRLRESNTLTATSYRPGPRDSTFLFFTDDALPVRPLLGALNLLVGLGDAAVGLVTAPVDGGHRLRAGARGALYSLPELVFVNLRKGTTAYLEPAEIP